MEAAMHAARLAAAHDALLALLTEFNSDGEAQADSITVNLSSLEGTPSGFDLTFCRNAMPVGGEGF